MYCRVILYFSIVSVLSKRHVIRLSPKLRQQGYYSDIDLGEVTAEAMVDSPEACRSLCKDNSACHSVMFMGKLCRMFSISHCLVSYSILVQLFSDRTVWLKQCSVSTTSQISGIIILLA